MAHPANRLPSTGWGELRNVSAWFTAHKYSATGRQPVHISAGREIRIRDTRNGGNVVEIVTASDGVLHAHRRELEGRSHAASTVGGISIGGGARSRAAEPGSFSTRGIDITDFMSKMTERQEQAEVTVTRAFVAMNAVSSSPDVPLQRGTRLLLFEHRAADDRITLALTQQGWSNHGHLHAAVSVITSTCLPTDAAMARYRTPIQASNSPAASDSPSNGSRGEPSTPPAQMLEEDSPRAEEDAANANLNDIDSNNAVAHPADMPSDNDASINQQIVSLPATTMPPPANPIVAALQALQPNGTFNRPLLTRNELRALASLESRWTLQELQFRLASIAQEGFTMGFGLGRLAPFMDPANINQLLPVFDPLLNPSNESFTSSNGRIYVMSRIMSSSQARVVHQGQNACTQCQKVAAKGWGKKRYCQCVTVADANGEDIVGGACSNCAHNDHPESCSFYTGE